MHRPGWRHSGLLALSLAACVAAAGIAQAAPKPVHNVHSPQAGRALCAGAEASAGQRPELALRARGRSRRRSALGAVGLRARDDQRSDQCRSAGRPAAHPPRTAARHQPGHSGARLGGGDQSALLRRAETYRGGRDRLGHSLRRARHRRHALAHHRRGRRPHLQQEPRSRLRPCHARHRAGARHPAGLGDGADARRQRRRL